VVDWHEVWSREYWREYLGPVGGAIGWGIQRACVRVPQRAFCFSRLYAERLRKEGFSGDITTLDGEYDGQFDLPRVMTPDPLIVFAGRHIPEKRVPSIIPALALVRASLPQLRAAILGDGPERPDVLRLVAELGLDEAVEVPGFVGTEEVSAFLARALCMILPSRREGYGLVVIEAAATGTPSIVVASPDNAAVELVTEGENGFIARSASASDLAAAILCVHEAGPALRESTAAWFARNARRLSMEASLEITLLAYDDAAIARS
jgi:glycosyltransferase involved in cell wall biosynthesis